MKQIEKASFSLLVGSILFIVIILGIHGLDKYLDEPSLFISPPESKSRTSLNMVLEANNLEGLKKICALWASQDDRENNALDALIYKIEEIKRDNIIFTLFISFMFILGSAHIYILVRKLRKKAENAL